MNQRIWLRLLVTTAIVASPLMADTLPEGKLPGRFSRGCHTGLIKDSKALSKESNIAEAIACVKKMAEDPDFKKKNPNFQKELKTGKLQEALETDYSDDPNLSELLSDIAKASGTSSIKDELAARKAKEKAKEDEKSAKSDIKNADKLALADMLTNLEEEEDLIAASGITQLDDREDYGDQNVEKEAKKPLNTMLTESKASNQKLGNLGYMIAAVAKLQGKGAKDIPNNPKFINAAAQAVADFWSTEDAYGSLDEAGFKMVQKLVHDVAVLKGALDYYTKDLAARKRGSTKALNAAQRTRTTAKDTLKGRNTVYKKGKSKQDIVVEEEGASDEGEGGGLKKKSSVEGDD